MQTGPPPSHADLEKRIKSVRNYIVLTLAFCGIVTFFIGQWMTSVNRQVDATQKATEVAQKTANDNAKAIRQIESMQKTIESTQKAASDNAKAIIDLSVSTAGLTAIRNETRERLQRIEQALDRLGTKIDNIYNRSPRNHDP